MEATFDVMVYGHDVPPLEQAERVAWLDKHGPQKNVVVRVSLMLVEYLKLGIKVSAEGTVSVSCNPRMDESAILYNAMHDALVTYAREVGSVQSLPDELLTSTLRTALRQVEEWKLENAAREAAARAERDKKQAESDRNLFESILEMEAVTVEAVARRLGSVHLTANGIRHAALIEAGLAHYNRAPEVDASYEWYSRMLAEIPELQKKWDKEYTTVLRHSLSADQQERFIDGYLPVDERDDAIRTWLFRHAADCEVYRRIDADRIEHGDKCNGARGVEVNTLQAPPELDVDEYARLKILKALYSEANYTFRRHSTTCNCVLDGHIRLGVQLTLRVGCRSFSREYRLT